MVLEYALYARDTAAGAPANESPQKLAPQVSRTCVSEIFFGDDNLAALAQGVRYGVFKASGGQFVIGEQSRDELVVVMHSVYLEYSRNLPYNLLEQVRELNARVLEFCVPRVAREAAQYRKYRFDSTHQPVPMGYGAFTSRAGLRGGDPA